MNGTDLAELDRDALITLVRKLAAEVESLREVEALKGAGKRQAAPFSKGTRAEAPKPPGRKPGPGGIQTPRGPRRLEQLSEPPINVPVVELACPKCGGLVADRVEEASIVDLPAVVRPRVRLFRIDVRRCMGCGATSPRPASRRRRQPARGDRPSPGPAAAGGESPPLWPGRAGPQAADGLRTPGRREAHAGGAVTRDALKKAAGAIGAAYQGLCDSIREAPYVHTDDTGWRQGGSPAWLMVFETDRATVYQVRPRHRNEEVRERIPADYAGVMITDRGTSYDAAELAGVKKQKCLGHVLRSVSEVLEEKTRGARRFAKRLKGLLKEALAMWHERGPGRGPDFAARLGRLKWSITDHLRDRALADGDNQRLLNELGRCHDAGSLVRFLDEPGIEPTNNRAERALRPAVIARKMSQCTKTARGTRAFEAWTSVIRTLSRTTTGPDLLDALVQLIQRAAPQPA